MEFKASLRLPCESPEIVATAIRCEDSDCDMPEETYSHEDGYLVVNVSAAKIKDLSKSLNSLLSRFKLSVESIEMCKKLGGRKEVG
ncbi:transcription factor Pcc1-like protein [Encephalitozoon intestinalis ATCC 50506]|uniref:Transcription factor Pcc1-like protein n=1 Tax=Encephalitozoon intestinalis (strain ATCC 50506) TaxID=876142 RepID=W8Q1U2_ENCIT|nr:transcription factor Pcc1-like protein [Encephalitozoon intestinalis ATCC 50506]AHL30089.1 transcription factor Pcc1-like protein [Encephalitozoon intestinalis ATCC 50506]UTX45030.1 ekc/keops complex subunit LAGE3 [Encephalitozoon intestinalis]